MASSPNIHIEKIASYEGHTGSVFAMAVDELEEFAYTSGDDGIVARWDLKAENQDATALLRADRAVYSLCLSAKHRRLFAGSSDGTLYVYDLGTKQLLQTYRKTSEAIYHMEVHGDRLWICQGKGFLSAWHIEKEEEVFFARLSQEHLRIMIPGLQASQSYIGASDNYIYLLDREAGKLLDKWEAHDNSVFGLLLHPDNKYLISGSRDAHFNVWDLQNGRDRIRHIPAHNFTINFFALSPDGHYFITASRDKTLKVWDAYDFSLLKVIDYPRDQAHMHSVNKVFWLKKDHSILSCGDDRQVLRWKLDIEKKD